MFYHCKGLKKIIFALSFTSLAAFAGVTVAAPASSSAPTGTVSFYNNCDFPLIVTLESISTSGSCKGVSVKGGTLKKHQSWNPQVNATCNFQLVASDADANYHPVHAGLSFTFETTYIKVGKKIPSGCKIVCNSGLACGSVAGSAQ